MATPIALPLLGDIMREGLLVEWLAEEGAALTAGQPLYRLETDKVTMEVEAPASGRLQRVAEAGDLVPVGETVAYLLAEGEAAVATTVAPPASHTEAESTLSSASAELEHAPSSGRADEASAPPAPRGGSPRADASVCAPRLAHSGSAAMDADADPSQADGQRASPRARRLARALGIDLATLAHDPRRTIRE